MSKDKAGKKDKLKHLDLFEMMLNQSQVFRDMVEQFQSAWVPRNPSVVIEAGLATRSPVKKPAKAAKAAKADAKAAPVAKPAKKRASRKSTAAAKPAPAAVKQSASKSPAKAKAKTAPSRTKQVTPPKSTGKAAATGRVAKKK